MIKKAILAAVLLILAAAWNLPAEKNVETATFAGGCFWCMEPPFEKMEGVLSTTAGYTGGSEKNPTYEEVSSGSTGHAESIEVVYDPSKVDYARLLQVFWHNIDPVSVDGQFCDSGTQHRSAIFYHDERQKQLAESSKAELEASHRFKQKIATQIVPAGKFWPAEEYHQDCEKLHVCAEFWGYASSFFRCSLFQKVRSSRT
jgi:peptide-methionine (S)-S-oxide reductase